MDDFKITTIKKILIVKPDFIVATLRDAKPLWDEFESKLLFKRDKIIIDLSSCNNVDSTFIGMIIKIFRRVKEENGELKLVFPQMESTTQFWTLGITRIIPCFNSQEEAINCFEHDISLKKVDYNEGFNIRLSLNDA